jgi:hypothetical protein
MASFKMRNSRTKKYNPDGSRIYNTFNSTGLVNKYENRNARFDSRNNTGRKADSINPETGKPYNNCSCTIAGCGTQCCLNHFLVENVDQAIWNSTESTFGLKYGTALEPGNSVYTALVINNTVSPTMTKIGTIQDILFPNSCSCIPMGVENATNDCSGAFPLNVRLILSTNGESCVLKDKFISLPYDSSNTVTGLFFKDKNGEEIGGIWSKMSNSTITDDTLIVEYESYEILGNSRTGAPYRAPIAGYRKTLACCCKSNLGKQKCISGCKGECYIELIRPGLFKTPLPMRNEMVYLSDGTFFGTVTDFSYSLGNTGINSNLRFAFNSNKICQNKYNKLQSLASGNEIKLYRGDGSLYQPVEFTIQNIKMSICTSKEATNDVYKDSYAIACQQDTRVCYDKRIRSGMQPKQQFCVEYTEVSSDGNVYHQKHKKLLCPTDVGWQKPYSYSYSQYNKNKAMITYERGLEKYSPLPSVSRGMDSSGCCPDEDQCKNPLYPNTKCCAKSLYRKGGGDACLNCGKESDTMKKQMSRNSVTIWKPNNAKFKVQGAVTSGSRMERLKLDTVKAANSKCKKGERCDKNKIGKGKYFAGKPRFTGWIYNKRHQERVWPNRNISAIRYRPQPLGIPQLTRKGRSTRSNKGKSNWRPHSAGTYGLFQRETTNVRAPGYGNKCVANCPMDCEKPIGQRTFKEWSNEYNGANNARYQGNIKCYEPPANLS